MLASSWCSMHELGVRAGEERRAPRRGRRSCCSPTAHEQRVQRLVEQRPEDLVLAAEVAVDGRAGDAGALADLVDADGVEPALVEQPLRGLEDLAVPLHRARVPQGIRPIGRVSERACTDSGVRSTAGS